jgi:hypothetical protein
MIRVRGPDGVINNFPDGTPDSVITQAMGRHYGAPGVAAQVTTADIARRLGPSPQAVANTRAYQAGQHNAGGLGGAVHAGLETIDRAIPGASELSALGPTLVATVDDAIHGRHGPNDGFAADWNQVRARQSGEVDANRAAHPFIASQETGTGYALPAALSGGASLLAEAPAAAATAAPVVSNAFRPVVSRLAATGARNAITGAAIAGGYGLSQPGTLQQRVQAADAALPTGAALGVAVPVGARAAGAAVNAGRQLVEAAAPKLGVPTSVAPAAPPAAATGGAPGATGGAPGATPAAPTPGAAAAPRGAPGAAPASVAGLSPVESAALTKFVRVASPDVNAMTGRATAFRTAGIDPTLVDTIGRGRQGVIRALASRPGDAQEAVEDWARQRATALPGRISTQARNIISSEPATPAELAKQVVDARTELGNTQFGAVRDVPVQITQSMADALKGDYGQQAIREAAKRTTDPQGAAALNKLANQLQSPGGTQAAKLTIGQAQDISEVLFAGAKASADADKARALNTFGKQIRDGARIQSPQYEEALTNFHNASRLADAPAMGAKALTQSNDQFVPAMADLRTIPPLPTAQGTPGAGAPNAFAPAGPPPAIPLARAGYRRAIEEATGNHRPGSAMGVADVIADTPEMQQANEALLGPEDARRLENNLRLETKAVRNAYAANPGAGSPTAVNGQNIAAVAGKIVQGVGSVVAASHGAPLPAAAQTLEAVLRKTQAFNDQEAQALALMAIDPARHDDALQFIASRAGTGTANGVSQMVQSWMAPAPAAPAAAAAAGPIPTAMAIHNAFASAGAGAPPTTADPNQTPPY